MSGTISRHILGLENCAECSVGQTRDKGKSKMFFFSFLTPEPDGEVPGRRGPIPPPAPLRHQLARPVHQGLGQGDEKHRE